MRERFGDRYEMFIYINVFPTLMHLSVFIFFAGLAILLFHVNRTVFKSVIWLIAVFSYRYVVESIFQIWRACISMQKPKWKIDANILRWTIDALCDDDGMEDFFDAIPGFFKSKRVRDLRNRSPDWLLEKLWKAANGFFERTLSSESVLESDKHRRLDIGMNALSAIPIPNASSIPKDILFQPWDQEPQNIEMCYTMARWCTSENSHIAHYARCIATRILASVRERNQRWIELAVGLLGLSADDLRAHIARGDDSLSLAILISVARRDIHSDFYDRGLLSTLYRLNILNTCPELQHDFCMLWNDCVEKAKRQPPDTSRVRHELSELFLGPIFRLFILLRTLLAPPSVTTTTPLECRRRFSVEFLRSTRSIYIRLHHGTHFSASTPPESYPSCDIQNHRTDSTISNSHAVPISTQPRDSPNASPHQPAYGSSDALRLAEVLDVVTETPLHDIITREMRRGSLASPAISPALPVHSNSYSLDGTKQQDVAVPSAGQNFFTAPTPSPVPASTGQIPNQPFGSYDAGPATTPTLPLLISPVIPTTSSHTPRLPDPELLALLSGMPLSSPRDSATLSRSRARGIMSQGNMYFTNAVLQLLVHCPPFWNLFNDLGRLTGQTGQRGQGEGQQTSGGTAPLVDATVRLLDDFAYKKEDDGTEPFTPMYVYDAMKEKGQFKSMLVRSCAQVALSCY
jgi:hypothetical protein